MEVANPKAPPVLDPSSVLQRIGRPRPGAQPDRWLEESGTHGASTHICGRACIPHIGEQPGLRVDVTPLARTRVRVGGSRTLPFV